MEMKIGEKYLVIKMVGHEKVTVFPNKTKTDAKQPDFVANGVAVWVNSKKAPEAPQTSVESVI